MKVSKLLAGAVIAQGLALLGLSAANADEILTYTVSGAPTPPCSG